MKCKYLKLTQFFWGTMYAFSTLLLFVWHSVQIMPLKRFLGSIMFSVTVWLWISKHMWLIKIIKTNRFAPIKSTYVYRLDVYFWHWLIQGCIVIISNWAAADDLRMQLHKVISIHSFIHAHFRRQLKGHLFLNHGHSTLWLQISSALEKTFTYLLTYLLTY